MSRKKENLEGFIKSKLEEKKYAYDERLWTPVGTVLLEKKKKRRRRRLVFLPLLFGVGLASLFFIKSNNEQVSFNENKSINQNEKYAETETDDLDKNELKTDEQESLIFDKKKKTEKENIQLNKNTEVIPQKNKNQNNYFSKNKKSKSKFGNDYFGKCFFRKK